jgi:chemotaxis signal transduction protein
MTAAAQQYLIFLLNDQRFAFDLSQVAEVEELQVTWPIPMAPSCYIGAMNFHGTILAVMDLAAFLGLVGARKPEKVIVLDTRIASLALLVEKVIRIETIGQVGLREGNNGIFVCLPDGDATLLDATIIADQAGEKINE